MWWWGRQVQHNQGGNRGGTLELTQNVLFFLLRRLWKSMVCLADKSSYTKHLQCVSIWPKSWWLPGLSDPLFYIEGPFTFTLHQLHVQIKTFYNLKNNLTIVCLLMILLVFWLQHVLQLQEWNVKVFERLTKVLLTVFECLRSNVPHSI